MGNKYTRVLAVLWHWDPLKDQELSFDTVSIKDDEKSLVCRIQDERPVEAIGADMKSSCEKAGSEGKLIMMVHRESLDAAFHQELKNKIEKRLPSGAELDWKVFGGGSDYIYYNCRRDTGLLNQEGDFVIDDSYAYFSEDGELLERLASVVVQSNEERPILKRRCFEQVWSYYHLELKKRIYELERDLFLHFAPFTDPESGNSNAALGPHLNANELLALRLQCFAEADVDKQKAAQNRALLISDCSENIQAAYGPEAAATYRTLKQAINSTFLNHTPESDILPHVAIPQVRQQFVKLRSFMPERITY